ncbi:hypothetical protein [Caudoviricetes sp.]|nr:hypothetical protein [Caudoviricetes sp.]
MLPASRRSNNYSIKRHNNISIRPISSNNSWRWISYY